MNRLCYRLVFNRTRGLLMAVAESARSQGAGGDGRRKKMGKRMAAALSREDVVIEADHEINLQAAATTRTLASKNSSSSASLGVVLST